jgi:hypothetical protein
MKIKIDYEGFLWIQRGTNFSTVHCPIMENKLCGDWCALFGEPDKDDPIFVEEVFVELELCHKVLKVQPENFADER